MTWIGFRAENTGWKLNRASVDIDRAVSAMVKWTYHARLDIPLHSYAIQQLTIIHDPDQLPQPPIACTTNSEIPEALLVSGTVHPPPVPAASVSDPGIGINFPGGTLMVFAGLRPGGRYHAGNPHRAVAEFRISALPRTTRFWINQDGELQGLWETGYGSNHTLGRTP
jgi:hypothetical protein